jgi:hypothetical protein
MESKLSPDMYFSSRNIAHTIRSWSIRHVGEEAQFIDRLGKHE